MNKQNDGSYRYRGQTISPTTHVNSKPWYIQGKHCSTGIHWDEQNCVQFYSLRQAKKHINDWMYQNDMYGE